MNLILTPLKSELSLLLPFFESQGLKIEKFQDQGTWYWKIIELNSIFSMGGHGKVDFALRAQKSLSFLPQIQRLFCVGAAGGLDPKVTIFDIVCSSLTIEHDYKEKFSPNEPLPSFQTDSFFTKKLNSVPTEAFNIHFGPVASGDEDIITVKRAEELREQTRALAVAWEGAGGARTAKLNGIPFVELRAITDNARSDVAQNFSQNLKKAMEHLAHSLFHSLKS